MNRFKKALGAVCFAFLLPATVIASQDSFAGLFSAPPTWTQVPSPQRSLYIFQTHEDKVNTLFVTVRFINVPKQTAMEWAQDEVKALVEKQDAKTLQAPVETKVGNNTFVHISSEMTPEGRDLISDQYFAQPIAGLVVEVAAVGPGALLESERQNLHSLLSSFSF